MSPAAAWYATSVLALLHWLAAVDRFVISLLVDPIKRDLGLTDVQFGALNGLAFAVSFTLFGLIFGALADRANRRVLIYIGVSIWSAATVACGVAHAYWHLWAARVGVAIGEASLHPTATSMISDLFPREKLTMAMAIYGLGSTIGSGSALMVGGAIVQWVSDFNVLTLPVFGDVRPWQAVFLIVGLPGMLVAFLMFSVPEPARRGRSASASSSSVRATYMALAAFIKSHRRFFCFHYFGFTCASAIITGATSWYPAHMTRSYGWSAGEVGAVLGPMLMIAGIASKIICARIVDVMYQRGYRDAQMRFYGFSLLVAGPIGIFGAVSSNPWAFLVAMGVFTSLIGAFLVCALTALTLVTPNNLRGSGVAVFTTIIGIVAGGVGPMLTPAFSEHFFSGEASLGYGLASLIAICCPLGAASLLCGLRYMRSAVAEMGERPLPSNS